MKNSKLFATVFAVLAIVQFSSTPAHATADATVKNTAGFFSKIAADGKYYPASLCYSTDGSQALVPCREGGTGVTPGYLDTSVTAIPISSGAYVSVIATTSAVARYVSVYNGSATPFALATGALGSEVDKLIVGPSGWTPAMKVFVPAGTRLSARSKGAAISSGLVIVNLLQ